MEMATDMPSTFKDKSCIKMVGFDMSKKAADKVFQEAGTYFCLVSTKL
jgi:sterol carrier protein 2